MMIKPSGITQVGFDQVMLSQKADPYIKRQMQIHMSWPSPTSLDFAEGSSLSDAQRAQLIFLLRKPPPLFTASQQLNKSRFSDSQSARFGRSTRNMALTNFILTVAGVSAVVLLLRSDVKQSATIFRRNVKHIRKWLEEESKAVPKELETKVPPKDVPKEDKH